MFRSLVKTPTVQITAVRPPPIVNAAEITRSMTTARYKSISIDSLMNKAPENKSAYLEKKLFAVFEIYRVFLLKFL
jgi:hypothetical protein